MKTSVSVTVALVVGSITHAYVLQFYTGHRFVSPVELGFHLLIPQTSSGRIFFTVAMAVCQRTVSTCTTVLRCRRNALLSLCQPFALARMVSS